MSQPLPSVLERLDHRADEAMGQLLAILQDVSPVAISGLACDLEALSAEDRKLAVQLFSWAARCPAGFRALVNAHQRARRDIVRKRGLVHV